MATKTATIHCFAFDDSQAKEESWEGESGEQEAYIRFSKSTIA